MFGFVGPNGAGKTTTMRIVLGVLARRSRRGPLARRAGRRGSAHALRLHAGGARAVPEDARARRSSPTSRRCTASTTPEAAADRWIERLGLSERADDRVEELSLGNQQRVQLAAALVHEPELLVLDEPFSGLDPVGVDVLRGVLAEYAATGVPVVFSSHQLELVERLCEAVAIIKDGRLVASGTVEELRGPGQARSSREVDRAADAQPTCSGRRSSDAAVRLVARREITERVRERSFLISTGITLAIIVLVVVLPAAARLRRAVGVHGRRDRRRRAARSPSARSQLADEFDAKVTIGADPDVTLAAARSAPRSRPTTSSWACCRSPTSSSTPDAAPPLRVQHRRAGGSRPRRQGRRSPSSRS